MHCFNRPKHKLLNRTLDEVQRVAYLTPSSHGKLIASVHILNKHTPRYLQSIEHLTSCEWENPFWSHNEVDAAGEGRLVLFMVYMHHAIHKYVLRLGL